MNRRAEAALVQALEAYIRRSLAGQTQASISQALGRTTYLLRGYPSPSVNLAHQLAADPEFQAIRLGRFLATPSGESLTEIVAAILPPPLNLAAQIIAQAMALAAQPEPDGPSDRRLLIAGAAAVAVALLLWNAASAA